MGKYGKNSQVYLQLLALTEKMAITCLVITQNANAGNP